MWVSNIFPIYFIWCILPILRVNLSIPFNAVRVLESTWCFRRLNTSASGLRDHFKKFVDADDGVMISEVSSWASSKTDGTPKDLRLACENK